MGRTNALLRMLFVPATLFVMAKQKSNLRWKKVLLISDKEGNELEIESYMDALMITDLESGREYELSKEDLKLFIELISENV